MESAFNNIYSVSSKTGGWLNVGCVSIGIGLATISVSIFGFCGIHKKTSFLLVTYIILLGICLFLQTFSVIILLYRDDELKSLNSSFTVTQIGHQAAVIAFCVCGSFSVTVLLFVLYQVYVTYKERVTFKSFQAL